LNDGFWQWITEDVMSMDYNITWSQKQGMKFGRKAMKAKIQKTLEEIIDGKRDRRNKKPKREDDWREAK
jgi:uncharacterized protein VirK/YbjX